MVRRLVFLFFFGVTVNAQVWTEVAASRGVGFTAMTTVGFGAGVAFADFTGDDRPDLLLPGGSGQPIQFFVNDGFGSFVTQTALSNLGASGSARGVAVADIDADGDLDCFVVRSSNQACSLFLNNGAGVFTDVATAAGVTLNRTAYGAVFLDIELDGDLDLYVTVYGFGLGFASDQNALFINQGNGTFLEEGLARGVANLGFSYGALAVDVDADARTDLWIANDRGMLGGLSPNACYRNLGTGFFTDISTPSGLAVAMDGMGQDAGDIDLDGDEDLYVTNTPSGHKLHLAGPVFPFPEVASVRGVAANRVGWGALFFDKDHDRDLDLYVAHADPAPIAGSGDNSLFENDGSGFFTDVAVSTGVNSSALAFALAAADLEGDGDLDLVLPNSFPSAAQIYLNPDNAQNHWLRVVPRGRNGEAVVIGAEVRVTTGAVTQIRKVRSSQSYLSASDPVPHFGLGAASVVDRVEVRFPSGASAVHWNVPGGATLIVREPALNLGPLNLGTTVTGQLDLSSAAGQQYIIAASNIQTPPIVLGDGRSLGVGLDPLLQYFLNGAPGIGQNLSGTLSALGTISFTLMVPSDPSLSGGALRFGAIGFQPVLGLDFLAIIAPRQATIL